MASVYDTVRDPLHRDRVTVGPRQYDRSCVLQYSCTVTYPRTRPTNSTDINSSYRHKLQPTVMLKLSDNLVLASGENLGARCRISLREIIPHVH